jgi:uncharacterized membrane protein YgcG
MHAQADTHTLVALEDFELAADVGAADLSALRGGVVKTGSGSDFLDETVLFEGVKLATLGKRGSSGGSSGVGGGGGSKGGHGHSHSR